MLDQSPRTETPTDKAGDPLPWLIHNLLEKRAEHPPTNRENQATEPQKESP